LQFSTSTGECFPCSNQVSAQPCDQSFEKSMRIGKAILITISRAQSRQCLLRFFRIAFAQCKVEKLSRKIAGSRWILQQNGREHGLNRLGISAPPQLDLRPTEAGFSVIWSDTQGAIEHGGR